MRISSLITGRAELKNKAFFAFLLLLLLLLLLIAVSRQRFLSGRAVSRTSPNSATSAYKSVVLVISLVTWSFLLASRYERAELIPFQLGSCSQDLCSESFSFCMRELRHTQQQVSLGLAQLGSIRLSSVRVDSVTQNFQLGSHSGGSPLASCVRSVQRRRRRFK